MGLLRHIGRAVAGMQEGRRCFLLVVAASAALHGVGAAVLHSVEPAKRSTWEAPRRMLARGWDKPLEPVSPEPATALPWVQSVELRSGLSLRSTVWLDAAKLESLGQTYDRVLALFPAFAGVAQRSLRGVELRIVGRQVLNDPSYFDIQIGPDGVLYGLYFTQANVAYVTPIVAEQPRHLVHELAHYLIDEHAIRLDDAAEEARVRRFERLYAEVQRLQHVPHIHPEILYEPEMPRWAGRVRLAPGVEIVSERIIAPARARWLRHIYSHAAAAFPLHLGGSAHRGGDLQIRIVEAKRLNDRADLGAAGGSCRMRYFPSQRVAYVTGDVFWSSDLMAHVVGHHLVRSYGLLADVADEERLALSLGEAVRRRMLAARTQRD